MQFRLQQIEVLRAQVGIADSMFSEMALRYLDLLLGVDSIDVLLLHLLELVPLSIDLKLSDDCWLGT